MNIPYSKEQLMRANEKLMQKNKRYKQALEEVLEARNKFYLQDYVDGVEEVAEKALEVNK